MIHDSRQGSIRAVYFSPTGTTETIVHAAVEGTTMGNVEYIDITSPSKRYWYNSSSSEGFFPDKAGVPLVVGLPVYEEHIPEMCRNVLENLPNGEGEQALAIVSYGNIGFGSALRELYTILTNKGYNIAGAMACVGEHSFSRPGTPLAFGRPDAADLEVIRHVGRLFGTLISRDDIPNLPIHSIPVKIPLLSRILPRGSARLFTLLPRINEHCVSCGICIDACPAGAIKENLDIDPKLCIRCFACVKSCCLSPWQSRGGTNRSSHGNSYGGRRLAYRLPIVRPFLLRHNLVRKKNQFFFPEEVVLEKIQDK